MVTAYKQKEEYMSARILPHIGEYEYYACEDNSGYEEWLDRIDITDDYMFAHVMKNEEICKGVVSCLFPEHKIYKIKYVAEPEEQHDDKSVISETQKTLSPLVGRRSVRFDAYIDDGKTIYDIEMQTVRSGHLPKRARLYQSHIDINQLQKGDEFSKLRPSYIIFICKFDPFGKGFYRYSFENICRENKNILLNDEAYKIFFNTTGHIGEISRDQRELLKYMNNTSVYDARNTDVELIKEIDKAVEMTKRSEWRHDDMLLALKYRLDMSEAKEEGRSEGMSEGINIGLSRGRSEGINIGLSRGRMSIALKMLKMGKSVEEISELTELSACEINKLKEQEAHLS